MHYTIFCIPLQVKKPFASKEAVLGTLYVHARAALVFLDDVAHGHYARCSHAWCNQCARNLNFGERQLACVSAW